MLFQKRREIFGRKIALALDRLGEHGRRGERFLHALLAHEKEDAVAVIKARVLECLLGELRLAGLQKAGEEIYGDLFCHGLFSLSAEELGNGVLVQLVTDDAQPPRHTGAAAADVDLARRVVKVDPLALARGDDALRAQHGAVFGFVLKRGERSAQTVLGELLRRFHAPGREHLVRVVAVVMVMMAAAALVIVVVLIVIVMVVLMVVAAAALVLMLVLIVVVVMMLVLMPVVVIVIVIVVMAAAGAVAVFIEMMMVLVFFVLVVVMMVMLVLILVLFVLALNAFKRGGERVALFHRVEDLRAGELVPRRRDDDGAGILLAQQRDALGELFLLDARGAGEDDAPGGFDLVVEKFAEVAHIHFAFARVYDGAERVDRKLAVRRLLHGGHDVGELADARGLDEGA